MLKIIFSNMYVYLIRNFLSRSKIYCVFVNLCLRKDVWAGHKQIYQTRFFQSPFYAAKQVYKS